MLVQVGRSFFEWTRALKLSNPRVTMTTTMTHADFEKTQIYRFRRYDSAERFADHDVKSMIVLLGDDERFWVVTMANVERSLRAKYELAPRVR